MNLNEDFIAFLVEAKRNTYASGNGSVIDSIKRGSKDLSFKDKDFEYMDSYFGELNFIGQEIVWHNEKPIWGMNYYGLTLDPIEGFPQFLFECLKQVSFQMPYRGPINYKNNDFEYSCSWTGDINNFQGEESIRYKNEVIYNLTFHGGNTRDL